MKAIALLMLLMGFAINSAGACSVKEIARPQLLVEQAHAIYHVRAVGYVTPLRRLPRDRAPKIRFSVINVIKGPRPLAEVQFAGILVQADDRNDHAAPYGFVRPAGRHGMCFATEYRAGAKYLMLIKGGTPYWARLAPTNEQLSGPNDPWLLWVKRRAAGGSKPRLNVSFKPKPLSGSA